MKKQLSCWMQLFSLRKQLSNCFHFSRALLFAFSFIKMDTRALILLQSEIMVFIFFETQNPFEEII